MKALTADQSAVFEYLRAYIAENARAPTNFEISHNFGWKTDSCAHQRINALVRKGFVKSANGAPRGISIVGTPTPDPASMVQALRVIRTWAQFDNEAGFPRTLNPRDVLALCDKVLL